MTLLFSDHLHKLSRRNANILVTLVFVNNRPFCRARLQVSVTYLLQFLFGVCVCVSASFQICLDHNLYNNAWISKQFGTVVALEEEICLFKHF